MRSLVIYSFQLPNRSTAQLLSCLTRNTHGPAPCPHLKDSDACQVEPERDHRGRDEKEGKLELLDGEQDNHEDLQQKPQ